MYKLLLLIVFLFSISATYSQKTRAEKQKQVNELHKNRAAVERFDQSIIETKEQKDKKQIANKEKRSQILSYLDTVSIAEGARKKLRRDLDENPFSGRFLKFMTRYRKEVLVKNNSKTLVKQ